MRLDSIAFIMTDRCSAACDMCCFSCTPKGQHLLDKEIMKRYISEAAGIGTVKSVNFSGGEAILFYDQLKECIACASDFGMSSTLVTNGFWAKDYEKGYEMMRALAEAGLRDLSISVDKFHQKYVPVESVRNAIRIADELQIMSAITLMDLKDGQSVYDSMEQLRPEIYDKNLIIYPVFPAGKAAETIPEEDLVMACSGADARCSTDQCITFLYDGSMMMCCSQFSRDIPMVHLGTFGETSLQEALDHFNQNDFIYVMFSDGLSWYWNLAKELGFPVRGKYCVSCHLCHELLGSEEFVRQAEPYVKKEADRLRLEKLFS